MLFIFNSQDKLSICQVYGTPHQLIGGTNVMSRLSSGGWDDQELSWRFLQEASTDAGSCFKENTWKKTHIHGKQMVPSGK